MIEIQRTEPTPIEVKQLLTNLKNYSSWDYKHYPLTEEEGKMVLELIREVYGDD